jgi:hypothetical protein
MVRPLMALFGLLALVAPSACGESVSTDAVADPMPAADVSAADPRSQFAGAWSLARMERRDADGELLSPPVEDLRGYLIYAAAGYMAVTLMQPDRESYSEGGPTAEEALAELGGFTSYFGPFSVNEAEGYVTHHLEGSLNPGSVGADNQRFYTFTENSLTLQPPAGEDGSKLFIVWDRLPELPESELTDTHRRLFGFYRIESFSPETSGSDSLSYGDYDTGYIIYAPSGHMAVHLMRPGHTPYVDDRPTAEEALRNTRTYASYFGPFSVHEDERYLVHHRIGHTNPGQSGTDAQRFYEFTDTHLMLSRPIGTGDDDEGRELRATVTWARVPLRP